MKDEAFENVLEDLRKGKMVLLQDDENRENEGDLVISAEKITPEDINFMASHGRGLICVTIRTARAKRLSLYPMTRQNTAELGTAFTVSVDARDGVSTGISAADRARTVEVIIDDDSEPEDLVRPGHLFPLVARENGVFERRGQTEGSLDLMKLAGLKPVAVICEVMNSDGTMARDEELKEFCEKHHIRRCHIDDIVRYRSRHEQIVDCVAETHLTRDDTTFRLLLFRSCLDDGKHLVLSPDEDGTSSRDRAPLVRLHSRCLTGDVFGSNRCDCREQLELSLERIADQGGILIYSPQEGRGIGLENKLKAYEKKDQGMDTVEANETLGLPKDRRNYWSAANILSELGCTSVRLLTNNPQKVKDLENMGVQVVERISLEVESDGEKQEYLRTKKNKLGHIFQEI